MIDNLTEAIEKFKNFAECEIESAKVLRGYGNEKDAKYFEETAENDKNIVAWLTELQERREADRWIPVRERLPEDYTRVLITNEYGEVICIDWNTWYQKEYKDARKSYKATAWRPLPEPYESEATNE